MNSINSDTATEISVYRDNLLTKQNYEGQKNIILAAFPNLATNEGWFLVLMKRMKEKNFTNKRLEDAVNNLIDTCKYPIPAPAEILSFDRAIKLLTFEQMKFKAIKQGQEVWELYSLVDIEGVPMYARNEDKIRYNLTQWEIKPAKIGSIEYPGKEEEKDESEKWKGMFTDILTKNKKEENGN